MSLLKQSFYHLREQDFKYIQALDLKAGDALSVAGPGNTYGAAVLTDVTKTFGGSIVVEYGLPAGVNIRSTPDQDILVDWQGQKPRIRVEVLMDPMKKVMVR